MRVFFFAWFLLASILLLFPQLVEAKKILPQALGNQVPTSSSSDISIYGILRADHKALTLTMGSLENAKSVSYFLSYSSNEGDQGAGGSLTLDGSSSSSRELTFGTCSTSACTYNTGITNMKLVVTVQLTNGKQSVRTYKVLL